MLTRPTSILASLIEAGRVQDLMKTAGRALHSAQDFVVSVHPEDPSTGDLIILWAYVPKFVDAESTRTGKVLAQPVQAPTILRSLAAVLNASLQGEDPVKPQLHCNFFLLVTIALLLVSAKQWPQTLSLSTETV